MIRSLRAAVHVGDDDGLFIDRFHLNGHVGRDVWFDGVAKVVRDLEDGFARVFDADGRAVIENADVQRPSEFAKAMTSLLTVGVNSRLNSTV